MAPVVLAKIDVLGVETTVGDVSSAADAVIARALSGRGGYAVMCNVHVLMTARRRGDVMNALREAWAVFPDGAPVAWMQRRGGERRASRIGGPDLMPEVLARGTALSLRHGLLGSTPDVLRDLHRSIEAEHAGIEISFAESPRPGEEDDPRIGERIRASGCDILWLALGAPKQELWMRTHARQESLPLTLGVGAAFDFHAGKKTRAPTWMQESGLEWAYRLTSEPSRLMSRYITTNSSFMLAASWHLGRRWVTSPRDRAEHES